MRKTVQILFTCSLALMVVGLLDTSDAHARKQYRDAMNKAYPELTKKHGTGKEGKKNLSCKVCHPGKTKKKRNDYGAALGKALGKKNEKDEDKLKKAFEKIAKEKSSKDKEKTFGELIKDNKLPGSDKEAK
jgi:hypothetical protein